MSGLTLRLLRYILLVLAFAGPATANAQSDPDPSRFESEIERFRQFDARNTVPSGALLFVGSSSIRLWETAGAFPQTTVINRGFGGAHISDVNHYIRDIVLKYAPQAIFFYSGDNDVWDGKNPEQVRKDFRQFLDLVRASRTETDVYFISIKPSPSRWSAWEMMRRANEVVAEMASREEGLTFVDVANPMLVHGRPDSSLFVPDLLHLNPKGYRVWESVVSPYVSRYHHD